MQQRKGNISIRHLFVRIANSDKDAFDALFRLQYANLCRFAHNFVAETGVAEEVVSDVFVWLWTHRMELAAVSNPDTYLFTAVKNRCLNTLRQTSQTVPLDACFEKDAAAETPLAEMEREELSQKLRTIVAALPEQQRIVFNMIKENGLIAAQCADILHLSRRTVETHLYKALKQLEKEIADYLGYQPKKKQMDKMLLMFF